MNIFKSIANKFCLTKQSRRCRAWFEVDGDHTLRLDYLLDKESIVFDLGGYKGQWASDIFSKYCCEVYVFEPVKIFSKKIEQRFKQNEKIKSFPFGLAEENKKIMLAKDQDSSSAFKAGVESEWVELREFQEFLESNKIRSIDLMKINIEGAEYDLLESIIERDIQTNIKNFQIQFHDFVPDAEKRMKDIQEALKRTHEVTWQYPFVWENWRIRNRA